MKPLTSIRSRYSVSGKYKVVECRLSRSIETTVVEYKSSLDKLGTSPALSRDPLSKGE